jgi:hypothetical protein
MEFVLSELKGANIERKSIIQGFSIFLALILFILTSGCATTATRMYTGDALPKEQVAIIAGRDTFLFLPLPIFWVSGSSVEIREVDGKPLFRPTRKCEVLPGLHNLVVQAYYTRLTIFFNVPVDSEASRSGSLQFNTEAGHQYKIKVRYRNWQIPAFRVNVIDTKSAEIVGSYP